MLRTSKKSKSEIPASSVRNRCRYSKLGSGDKPIVDETKEHRRYQRLQLPSSTLVSLQGLGAKNSYRCTDLGLGGMLVKCSEPLPVGSVVRFAIKIGTDTIRGLAAVRRTTSHEMGLAYTSLKIEDRAKLRTFLDGLAARSKQMTP